MNTITTHTRLQELPLSAFRPEGWYRQQLEVQADGLTGHLEEIWDDVGPDSGWLGGSGENWERGPYYLDGLVPLAYLLQHHASIEKSQQWIEWMLQSQQEDGFFGPAQNRDWWPRMVALKVIIQYYEATQDQRVPCFMEKYFAHQLNHLRQRPLEMWGVARAGENIFSVLWLYDRTRDPSLLELAELLAGQSLDWKNFFRDFPYPKPMDNYLNWTEYLDIQKTSQQVDNNQPTYLDRNHAEELFQKYHFSHGVNIAMALKYPAQDFLRSSESGDLEALERGVSALEHFHGQLNGLYSCDEHLNGLKPSTGTELCTVVEAMFSLQRILMITAETKWADRLEHVAYNALPAAISADFCSHQYDQQVNQIECSVAPRDWYNNTDDSNIFGLAPHFGCCTANMHQGWPKFVKSFFAQRADNELLAMVYGPCTIRTTLGTKTIEIREETDYPFSEKISFSFHLSEAHCFCFSLRIPSWAESAEIHLNGKRCATTSINGFFKIERLWQPGDRLDLTLPMPVRVVQHTKDYIGIMRGPLLFALPIEAEWKKLEERGRFSDWEVYPKDEWNYGICLKGSEAVNADVQETEGEKSFHAEEPPLRIALQGRQLLNWKQERHSAGPLPQTPEFGPSKTIELAPYGWTTLRIGAFPWNQERE